MGIRDLFSRLKKKLKHLLTERKRKSGGTGAETGGDRADPVGSVLQPVPHIVAGGSHDLEDDRVSTDGRQGLTAQLLQQDEPELVPAHGDEADQQGGEADVDRGEAGQVYSHPGSDAEGEAGCGPGQEGSDTNEAKVGQVHPSPSTPPIPCCGKLDGM